MARKNKVLILTDTPLGASGIKNLISENEKDTKIKILPIQKGSIDEIKKFSPSTIIYYRYKVTGVGYDVLQFFSNQSNVKLLTFNLNTNKMETYYHKTTFDAQLEDLFRSLNIDHNALKSNLVNA